MNREKANQFNEELEKVLSKMAESYSYHIDLDKLRFGSNGFSTKISVVDPTESTKYARDYKAHYFKFRFELHWLNQVVTIENASYKLLGFNYGKKEGLALEDSEGKVVFMTEPPVRNACLEQLGSERKNPSNGTAKFSFLSLSINAKKLEDNLIKSVYQVIPREDIAGYNFTVICQGFSEEDQIRVRGIAPEFNFVFTERIAPPISFIRRTLFNRVPDLFDKDKYKYVILIDDDFKFGGFAIDHYKHHMAEMDEYPEVGLCACHRRIDPNMRLETYPIEFPYPYKDISAISMRLGLIVRNGILTVDEMFDDRIMYHEEFYLAMQVYLKGYEIARGWVDAYHQSRVGGLGNTLGTKYKIMTSNEANTAKKILHDEGLFDIAEGLIYYQQQDVGRTSKLAKDIHRQNQEILGFKICQRK